MDPVDLEKTVGRALNALPQPRAPRTLLPRVMAAVEQSLAPWYSRAWVTWPAIWQTASVAALMVLVFGFARLVPTAVAAADLVRSGAVVPVPSSIVAVTEWVTGFWDASRIIWRVMVQPVIGYFVVFVFVMSAACVAFGTALNRVALGGASDL